jgi:gluconokinase
VHDELRSIGPLAIIVMGVAGSGKSTLGIALAGAIDSPFLEADDFHSPEAIARMRAGIPLNDDDRWPWLDRLGQAITAKVDAHGVAVATCSALKRVYRDRLREVIPAVAFVLADTDPEELLRRMTARTDHYMPPSLLTSQLQTLERPGSDELAITIDSRRPVEVSCEQIIAWLKDRGR